MSQEAAPNTAALVVLRNSKTFHGLPEKLLTEIARLSITRTYARDELVFQRNDAGDYLYGIISGRLRISVHGADGRELALSITGPGEIGGEISVLDGGTRTTTGTALESTTLFIVPREQFRELMLRQPTIALHMIQLLCERVRQTSRQVENAAFLTLPQRLAAQLQELVNAVDRPLPCTVKISQSELASFLNVSRQMVNSHLQAWQKKGYVNVARGSIRVDNLTGLLDDVF